MASIRREAPILFVGDVGILALSLWLALLVRTLEAPSGAYFREHLLAFIPVFAVSVAIFFIAGLYEKQTRMIRRTMTSRILGAQLASTLVAVLLFFFLPFSIAPKIVLALYLLISVVLVSLWRFFVTVRFMVANRESALMVGSGTAVQELLDEINNNGRYYIRFAEHLETKDPSVLVERIHAAVVKNDVRAIVIDTRDPNVKDSLPHLHDLILSGVSFTEFSSLYEEAFDRVPLENIDHARLLEHLPKRHRLYTIAKRFFDMCGATAGLFVGAIFVLPCALILIFSGGQPLISSERIGKEGKPFRLFKLRTKLFDDGGDPEKQKLNRTTSFGTFLRRTRIDELPQLWNVLTGELSFIGPRPELPKIVQVYEKEIPYYGIRHLITPGLSGWAQIWDYDAPRGGADVERTRRKLSYDLYYLKRRSFMLDMVIALKTLRALAVLSGK